MNAKYAATGLLKATIVAIPIVMAISVLAAGADQTLLLAVIINNYATGKIGEFVLRDGALFARADELRDLGLLVPRSVAVRRENLVALSDLSDFTYRIDQATQTLYVTAGMSRLIPTVLGTAASSKSNYVVESGTGVTLNYDVIGTSIDNRQLASGLFDLRAFSPWGVLSSGLLAYAGAGPFSPYGGYHTGNYSTLRLDSTFVYSDPERMIRYRAGDFISGFLPWTRSVRMGGAQINSDFSMRPDLITFPVPTISGSVAVPSTVDVLVNGSRVLSQQIRPGPFQVPSLPVITGAGTVSMTVTNALGQQVTTQLPFYASPALLAPGLQTYSVEAGFVRRNWGIVSDDYGSFAGAATYRRGLTSNLTVETHAEASNGLVMAGVGGVVNLGNLAVANLAIAGSTGSGHTGGQVAAAIQHIDQRYSFGASAILATHQFGDIAAINGDPISQLQLNANAGVSLGRYGSFGLAYTHVRRAAAPTPVPVFAPPGSILTQGANAFFFQPALRSQILSASYSTQLGILSPRFSNVSFYATAFHDFENRGDSGALVGLTFPLGSRTSASMSGQSGSGTQTGQIEVAQTASTVGQWGYRMFGSADRQDVPGGAGQSRVGDHEFGEVSYKSPWGMVFAGADRIGNQTTLQAEARGAVSFVDGSVFPSNRIDDAFAIVNTNGFGGIRVQQENREAGRTNSAGQLLVPDLRSFEINRISIDPRDAPIDTDVPFSKREVRPQDRSGVVVKFPLKANHGALLRLMDSIGKSIPVGSTATLKSTGAAVPVGYDGEAYLLDLQPQNDVDVELPDGRHCVASFDYRPASGEIPIIGPLPCREVPR